MPIYEYRCDQCGHQFEVIQNFSDNPLEVCDQCQGSLSKLISQTSFQLKGSGWYVTDYARKSASSTPAQETKVETKAETKAETKPASTPKTEAPRSSTK